MENIDTIVSVTGIDLVLEGSIGLSQSYGVPGQAQHPDVQAAILAVADACQRQGVPFCAVPRLPKQRNRKCIGGSAASMRFYWATTGVSRSAHSRRTCKTGEIRHQPERVYV